MAGSGESLDVRRAIAAGRIARRHLGLDEPAPETDVDTAPRKTRMVVLYVHLSEAAFTGGKGELARVENHHRTVLADQVRDWCATPDAEVIVKPVIDLEEHLHVEQYEVPDRLREQTTLRDRSCVFPWCTRSDRTSDMDHVIPYDEGGQTASDNLAPLCRRHHRLKTHSPWTYTVIDPGTYLWSSPHGFQFLRDRRGPTTSPATHPTPD